MRTLLFILMAVPALTLHAQTPLPPVVQRGLEAIEKGKCQEALDLWTGSWLEMQRAQMAPTCSALQQYGGEFRGYDVLKTVEISPHLNRVYILLLYSIQPVYLMLVLYRAGETDWRVSTVNWNTDPDKVIPASVMPAQRPGP